MKTKKTEAETRKVEAEAKQAEAETKKLEAMVARSCLAFCLEISKVL